MAATSLHPMMHWFYSNEGRQQGPITEEEVIRLIQDVVISAETLVWNETLPSWVKLSESSLSHHLEKRYAPAPLKEATPPPLPIVTVPKSEQTQNEETIQPSIPPIPAASLVLTGSSWYYREAGRSVGPVGMDEITRLYEAGRISNNTPLWNDSLPDWVPLSGTKFAPQKRMPSLSEEIPFSDSDLLKLATRLRNLILVFCGELLLCIVLKIGSRYALRMIAAQASLGSYVFGIIGIIYFLIAIYYLYLVYKVAAGIKAKRPWIYVALSFMPTRYLFGDIPVFLFCVGGFLIFKAIEVLKAHGLKLGWLGISSSARSALKERVGTAIKN